MNWQNLIAIEFSLSQNAFHVHSLEEAIAANFKNSYGRVQTDFNIVGIVSSHEQAADLIWVLREKFKLDNVTMYKTTNGQLIVT